MNQLFEPHQKSLMLSKILTEKLSSEYKAINLVEKEKIIQAISKVVYPFSVQNLLTCINSETALLLSRSTHPILQEWGERCKNFYANDPNNKYVQSENGLVITPQVGKGLSFSRFVGGMYENGYSVTPPSFLGHGVWSLVQNSWMPSSNSQAWGQNSQYALNCFLYKPILKGNAWQTMNPPHLSNNPIQLITPTHVAALIGDKALLEDCIKQGGSLENDCNYWHMTPLEMLIECEHVELLDYIYQEKLVKDLFKDSERVLKYAIEKGSFKMITLIIKQLNHQFSDEIIEAAHKRLPELGEYLELLRNNQLHSFLKAYETPAQKLKALINDFLIKPSTQLAAEFISCFASNVEALNLNELLFNLITEKNSAKVKALLAGIFEAGFIATEKLIFDIEKKNEQQKTALDVSLEIKDKDIISALILYANPEKNTKQTDAILQLDINFSAIVQQRDKLILSISQKHSQNQIRTNQALMGTIKELMGVANKQEEQAQEIYQLKHAIEQNTRTIFQLNQESNKQALPFEKPLQYSPTLFPLPIQQIKHKSKNSIEAVEQELAELKNNFTQNMEFMLMYQKTMMSQIQELSDKVEKLKHPNQENSFN